MSPYHDIAVLRAAGDDLVIVRTPVDVQHRPGVATHRGVGLVDAARLGNTHTLQVKT